MSSARNRSQQSRLALPGMRVHCVRVRRMMGRKHHLQRREHCSPSVCDSTTAADEGMYHRANAHLDSSWASSRPDYATAGPSSSSSHCRHNLATERRLIPDRFLEHNEDLGLLMPTGECVSSFLLSYSTTTQQRESSLASPLLLPTLPPVVQRIDMAGSPFSPFSPSNGPYGCYEENSFSQRRHLHPGQLLRAHSSGGGGSGGGGGDGSATAPADMTPGGGDSTDGDQPSEYTFRRRNAIVEGSDDAPKADDFPSSSPK